MANEKTIAVKAEEVNAIADELKNAVSVVLVDGRGLTVEEDTELRKELRKANVKYSVRKNSLTRKAAEKIGLDGLDSYLSGPTAIATSADSYTDAAKILNKYSKQFENLQIKCGIVDGEVVLPEKVAQLAKIPSKEGLLSMLLSGLTGNMTKLAIAVKMLAEKKQAEENA